METDTTTSGMNDPAAMAFDELRSEVITLRLAIQRLAAAPSEIAIPDYTETLDEIRGAAAVLVSDYKKLRDAPALAVTPDTLATQINAASAQARKAEQQSLASAEEALRTVARELAAFVESARTANLQNKWILAMFALGIVFGATVCWLFGKL